MITDCIEDTGTGPDPAEVEKTVSLFYDEFDIPEDHRLNIVFMNNTDLREYKKKLFDRDEDTDVISVLLEEEFEEGYLWGEIYVSSEMAEHESSKRNTTREDEMILYIIHGLLHLIGYEDSTTTQQKEMWDVQLAFLEKCGYDPKTFLEGSEV